LIGITAVRSGVSSSDKSSSYSSYSIEDDDGIVGIDFSIGSIIGCLSSIESFWLLFWKWGVLTSSTKDLGESKVWAPSN